MVIRTGKLGRICIRCNKTFIPTGGRNNKICPNCWKSNKNDKRLVELKKQIVQGKNKQYIPDVVYRRKRGLPNPRSKWL